jgi:transglutaminase-like putative cysteine protease
MARVYEFMGALSVQRGKLPPGVRGTRRTLGMMRELAARGSKEPTVREAAITAVRGAGVRPHDLVGQLRTLYQFVRDRIYFIRDIHQVETLQSPRYTLQVGAGDCDDRATLLVALARSIGIPADFNFRVIGADRRHPSRFSHVYVTARLGSHTYAMDPTYQSNPFGWEYPNPTRMGEVPA